MGLRVDRGGSQLDPEAAVREPHINHVETATGGVHSKKSFSWPPLGWSGPERIALESVGGSVMLLLV